uniref:Pex19-domain-containing protein n=1 Tax=Schizophyllum commune (strain H4-8 / FGSC 9210) TaxID=578458 RepID=D8QJR5_SCHCM
MTSAGLSKHKIDTDEDLDDLDGAYYAQTSPPVPGPPPPTVERPAFQRQRTNTRVDTPPVSVPGSGNFPGLDATAEEDEDALTAEFTKELARGMESLMKELGDDAVKEHAEAGKDMTPEEQERIFKAAWEAMLVEGKGAGGEDLEVLQELLAKTGGQGKEGKRPEGAGASSSSAPTASDFQAKIRQATQKLRESESNMNSSASGGAGPSSADVDSLEALLKSLDLDNLPDGDEEKELTGFLESMMSSLMSKEVLYEPMKELEEKMPAYLENPSEPLQAGDKERYQSQLICVRKIIATFDEPGYSDEDPARSKKIVDLMSEMQDYGPPPSAIIGQMPAGFPGMGADGQLPADCTIT